MRLAPLARAFLAHRRGRHDVLFLKENAEFLNIAECTGLGRSRGLSRLYRAFHAEAPELFESFPQYYRLLLSIVSDAEAMGLPPGPGAHLAREVARRGLAEGEDADLHRMEALRLCARHGVRVLERDETLETRVLRAITRAPAFALPDRRAAYALTHHVFYFSEYGRRAPDLPAVVAKSLLNAGLVALLAEDVDLLSEVCIALRYMGRRPPADWEGYIASELADFEITMEDPGDPGALSDDYHAFLVANWHQAVAGRPAFRRAVRPGRLSVGALMEAVPVMLTPASRNVLAWSSRTTPQFDAFLAAFCARGDMAEVPA